MLDTSYALNPLKLKANIIYRKSLTLTLKFIVYMNNKSRSKCGVYLQNNQYVYPLTEPVITM